MEHVADKLGNLESLDPALVRLTRDARGQLVFQAGENGKAVENVRLARCFPWSAPDQYLSIRDAEGNEAALLKTLEGLDPAVRRLVDEELGAQEFLPRILAIEHVDDRFDVMIWKVRTDRGPIELQVQHHEDIRLLEDGRVTIKDHAGGQFHVPDIHALDPTSRRYIEDRLA